MVEITDYTNRISETGIRNDRIGIIGDLFLLTHQGASEKEKEERHKRIAKLLKVNYDDYYELAKVIYSTGSSKINGNHWSYITAVMRNKKRGNHRE
jgi:hypothetical protein